MRSKEARATRAARPDPWDDEDDAANGAANNKGFVALTREQAQAIASQQPTANPWVVIAVQGLVGTVAALLAGLVSGSFSVALSALWGMVTAVVPGALMARGMTSRLTRLTPVVSTFGVMVWEVVKIGATLALLVSAPRIIQPLSWPALLATLAVCLSVYWFALLWRGRSR